MTAVAAGQTIRCMHGATADFSAAGGIATVHWLQDVAAADTRGVAESLLEQTPSRAHTTVFLAGAAGNYRAESYAVDGRRIQFCGHGALAAALFIFNELHPVEDVLIFSNAERSWQALRSLDENTHIRLRYGKPQPVSCAVPGFVQACLGVQPIAAATVGAATDYLILELANVAAVRQLQPDFSALAAATERAVIVTADTQLHDKPACVFRYFAPQYGNPEDAATGSAAVQLAAYWSPRLADAPFMALQISPLGALLQLACTSDAVELAARVEYG